MKLIWDVEAPASVDRYLLPDEHQLICVREHPAVLLGPVTLATARPEREVRVAVFVSNCEEPSSDPRDRGIRLTLRDRP
jgi:hypothetical protein